MTIESINTTKNYDVSMLSKIGSYLVEKLSFVMYNNVVLSEKVDVSVSDTELAQAIFQQR